MPTGQQSLIEGKRRRTGRYADIKNLPNGGATQFETFQTTRIQIMEAIACCPFEGRVARAQIRKETIFDIGRSRLSGRMKKGFGGDGHNVSPACSLSSSVAAVIGNLGLHLQESCAFILIGSMN
ncbi:hypothetical protein ACKU27_02525 [Sphingobium yanoikuyae]